MRRLRGGTALSEDASRGPASAAATPEDASKARLPQAWVPRVVNLAVAAVFLLFLVPLVTHLAGRTRSVQVLLVLLALPFCLVTFACLVSAARPGSLALLARKARFRRG